MNRAQAYALSTLHLPDDHRWAVSPPTATGCVAVTQVGGGYGSRPCPVFLGPDGRVWLELIYPGHLHHLRGHIAMWLDLHYQDMLTDAEVCRRLTVAVRAAEVKFSPLGA